MEELFGSIAAITGRLGAVEAVDEAMAFAAWKICSGEVLSGKTAPLAFHDRRLVIAVEDNMWKRQLEDLSPQMLVKLNAKLGQGSVRFVEFQIAAGALKRTGKSASSGADSEEGPMTVGPSLTAAANAIADDDLREKFLAAAAAYLGRQSRR